MKTLLLLVVLAASIYYYHGSAQPASTVRDTAAQPAANRVVAKEIIVAPAPSSRDRWKTGPNAYTDLKTGPNAQVTFEPFAPSEQATWNQTPGYTIVSGAGIWRH
jgi:hypothetical protein